MDVSSTQEKALENYFDALLFADDGSLFDDVDGISPLLSQKEGVAEVVATRSDALIVSQVQPYDDDLRAAEVIETVQSVNVPIINDLQGFEEPVVAQEASTATTSADPAEKAPFEETQIDNDLEVVKTPVVAQGVNDAITVITQSMTDDKFLFIQPMSVVGLKLALPMDRVSGVLDFETANLQLLPEGNTVLGTLVYKGDNIPVLNAAAIVIPDNHPRYTSMLARKNYQKILIVDQGRLAIAVDTVDEEVYLPTDNIRWNSPTSNYVWLAGTLTDYGYALINAERLVDYLN